MITQCCVVFDKKAQAHMIPFFCSNLQVAARAFADAANTPGHQLNRNPEDFTLHHLGTFDDEKAVFALLPQPVHLGNALMFKNRQAVQDFIQPGREALEGKI